MLAQRSNEWFENRLGRFTGSKVSDLMGVKGLGDTGKTLAFKKACEIVFGRDDSWDVETWDMKRGTEQEIEAFTLLAELKAKHFIKVEPATFFPLGENSGASPDGLIGNDTVVEIKCPRPEKFFKIVSHGISAIDKSWIDQMQHEMKCTNSKHCLFFAYLKWNGSELYHEIMIDFDKEHSDLIIERIAEAVIIRDEYVNQLQTNIQFDLLP